MGGTPCACVPAPMQICCTSREQSGMICHYTCSTTFRGQLLLAASRPRCPRVSELGARGQRAMSPMVRAQWVCAQRSEPGLNPPGSEAKGMGRLFCCQGGPMGGKQGIHSENCISWQAASHADLVLDCRNGRAERMPDSVMLNPVPQGSKRHSVWWA